MEAYVNILYVSDLQNLELASVADFSGGLGIQLFQELVDSKQNLEGARARHIERKLTRMFRSAYREGMFKFNHRLGSMVDILEDFKKDAAGLDLIVLGKRGTNADHAKGELGSTIERVLHTSACPCLVVPNRFHELRKVLIAYDNSEPVNRALHFVERNEFFSDCEIHILTINPSDATHDKFDQVCDMLRNVAKLNIVACERTGEVIREIDSYIQENGVNLLIIGAYSHSAIRHFFIGSSTLEIVRRSNIPVVTFR
jgi:nucleotide-binding universal stress UspA family protein